MTLGSVRRTANAHLRTSENSQFVRLVVDLPTFVRTHIAVDAQQIAPIESQTQAEWLDRYVGNLLTE